MHRNQQNGDGEHEVTELHGRYLLASKKARVFGVRQGLALRRIPSVLTVPILVQGSRSDNLRQSRQFLVGAVIGD
jgi:hypothetical protein